MARLHPVPTLSVAILAACLAIQPGCSSFHRQWQAAATQPATTDLAGAWVGTWRSEASGHDGELRAVVTRTGPGAYQAQYHAVYADVLTFDYTVELMETRQVGDRVEFQGQSDLGWLAGGVYHYLGSANATEWRCTYRSDEDHGVFEMRRVTPEAPAPASAPAP